MPIPPTIVVENLGNWMPGILSTVAAIIAAFTAYAARHHALKDREETRHVAEVANKVSGQITTLEININHRLEELIKAEGAKGLAEGIAQGIAQEQARQSIKEVAHAAGVAQEKAEDKK